MFKRKKGDKMSKVCVIGGGPAGLMAAYAAAKNGHDVVLLEKNEKLGKKIYITGKGRCNFTNDVPADEFLSNVVRGEKFLRGVVYAFPPQKVMEFFEENGMAVKTERGNRAFPVSDHASDVTKTLEKACKNSGVSVFLGEKVVQIHTSSMSNIGITSDIQQGTMSNISIMPRVVGVKTENDYFPCDYAIVATGGLSYPTTGSTGDGYSFAKTVGHNVVDLRAALCGINLHGDFFKSLQGLSLKNVSLTAKNGNKVIYSAMGEMLFTHFGISGPLVLTLSSLINRMQLSSVSITLDLKPALDEQTLDKRILRDFEKYQNKQIKGALCELLPSKLIPAVLKESGIPETKTVNVLSKAERQALIKTLKAFPLQARSLRGYEEAIVTSGGVNLSEIHPKTMESKLVQGLKFCGEVLDVDAFTGGFNMQIAFSTGYAAGNTIN